MMVKGFPEVRSFDDDVVRYVSAYKKVHKHLSTIPVGLLPETQTEKAQFCRAVTTSLLIEFAKKERGGGHVVFEKASLPPEPQQEPKPDVEEVCVPMENVSPEPSKTNSHDRASACSYWGHKLITDEKIDPKRVISRRLDAHTLPRSSFGALMQLKDDYKVERWQDIDLETLACFVYAEELLNLPSDKMPDVEGE